MVARSLARSNEFTAPPGGCSSTLPRSSAEIPAGHLGEREQTVGGKRLSGRDHATSRQVWPGQGSGTSGLKFGAVAECQGPVGQGPYLDVGAVSESTCRRRRRPPSPAHCRQPTSPAWWIGPCPARPLDPGGAPRHDAGGVRTAPEASGSTMPHRQWWLVRSRRPSPVQITFLCGLCGERHQESAARPRQRARLLRAVRAWGWSGPSTSI
jgi:hypothetical protein